LQEVVGYGLAIGFVNFTFSAIAYPLLRDYDPINLELKDVLPEIPRRLLAVTYYGLMAFYTTNYCAQFILLLLTCCEAFEKQTEWNLKMNKGIPIEKGDKT